MNNFIPYEYYSIVPSNLSSKTIIMIGRGSDETKRFILGIKSMNYIIKEIPESEMIVISELNIEYLQKYVSDSNLIKKIHFVGYKSNPERYYRNASLHIFPSLAEAFPNVLSEALVYGIPTILVGLDYVSAAKGGTIIIYDDSPLSIAKIAIKLLKDNIYIKKLGKEARENIKQFNNELLSKKWINLNNFMKAL
jgi:glycosyltransferase involved in cell wall biosynthesis